MTGRQPSNDGWETVKHHWLGDSQPSNNLVEIERFGEFPHGSVLHKHAMFGPVKFGSHLI